MCTTLLLACRFDSISAFPYTSIVVATWAWRISFCCTPMGAPVAFQHRAVGVAEGVLA